MQTKLSFLESFLESVWRGKECGRRRGLSATSWGKVCYMLRAFVPVGNWIGLKVSSWWAMTTTRIQTNKLSTVVEEWYESKRNYKAYIMESKGFKLIKLKKKKLNLSWSLIKVMGKRSTDGSKWNYAKH